MQAFMKSSLDYIEQNLKADITAEELAGMSGYSIWHYYKLFSQATGSSVLAYILKRRLDHALAEISQGRKAIDVVFEYGFDTYAGFYKAFMKMYGVSPKKYLSIYGEHKSKEMRGYYMISKKEITEGELREVLQNWDIAQDLPLTKRSVRCMDGNTLTEREWKVGEQYVLTMEERSVMIKHMRIQKALAAKGFTGAAAIKTKSGDDYVDGADMFILTPRATGEPLVCRINECDYKQFGYKYGRAIAKIHNALVEVEADNMPDEGNLYDLADSCISHMIKGNEQYNLGLKEEFFTDYKAFGELFKKLPKQLICHNAHPRNILFDDAGEVTGFEFISGGYEHCRERNTRLCDLCSCADEILGEWSGWWGRTNPWQRNKADGDIHEEWCAILAGMLHGYDSINKLTAEEKQAVYYAICSFKILAVATCSFDMVSGELKGWSKTNYDNLRYIVANRAKIDNIF